MSSDTSTLPYHLVVGLPALSPTMEVGILSEWYKNEGDAFQAGDAIAKIETDKAAIDFEAQDDGVVAKILISANDGSDIPVGTPIMITVEDVADVAAFKDYVYTATAAAPVAAVPPTAPSPPTSTIAPPPPPPVKAVVAAAAPPPPPAAAAAPVVAATPPSPPPTASPPTTIPSSTTTNTMSTAIPGIVYTKPKSPLAHTLFTEQTKYIELYGTTGQIPIS